MTTSPPQIKQQTLINFTLYTFLQVFLAHLALASVALGVASLVILAASPVFVLWFPDELIREPERQATLAEFGGDHRAD